jgi:hypothetical protein
MMSEASQSLRERFQNHHGTESSMIPVSRSPIRSSRLRSHETHRGQQDAVNSFPSNSPRSLQMRLNENDARRLFGNSHPPLSQQNSRIVSTPPVAQTTRSNRPNGFELSANRAVAISTRGVRLSYQGSLRRRAKIPRLSPLNPLVSRSELRPRAVNNIPPTGLSSPASSSRYIDAMQGLRQQIFSSNPQGFQTPQVGLRSSEAQRPFPHHQPIIPSSLGLPPSQGTWFPTAPGYRAARFPDPLRSHGSRLDQQPQTQLHELEEWISDTTALVPRTGSIRGPRLRVSVPLVPSLCSMPEDPGRSSEAEGLTASVVSNSKQLDEPLNPMLEVLERLRLQCTLMEYEALTQELSGFLSHLLQGAEIDGPEVPETTCGLARCLKKFFTKEQQNNTPTPKSFVVLSRHDAEARQRYELENPSRTFSYIKQLFKKKDEEEQSPIPQSFRLIAGDRRLQNTRDVRDPEYVSRRIPGA